MTAYYSHSYHCSIGVVKHVLSDYSALSREIASTNKALKFKVVDRVKITQYKNIFTKSYTKNWSSDSVFKTNPCIYIKSKIQTKNIWQLL